MSTSTQHTESSLFDPSLLPEYSMKEIPHGYNIRPIQATDYERGVLDVLRVLTTVGDITKEEFNELWKYWNKHNDTYFNIVITSPKGQVVAVGTLVLERKIIHQCGLVGHIEDIAVAVSEQGRKLGFHIIHALTHIAKSQGAYKVILDCSDHNVPFYEKCGFSDVGREMSYKFNNEHVRL